MKNSAETLKSYPQQQADFMDLCGQRRLTLLETLSALNRRDRKIIAELMMHYRLIDEEVNTEFKANFIERIAQHADTVLADRDQILEYNIDTLTLMADDCIDILYVVSSMLNKLGIPADAVWDEVQRSNMAKATNCSCNGYQHECPDCKGTGKVVVRRADGKILKPEGWTPPDIRNIIVTELKRLKAQANEERQLERQNTE